MTPLSIYILLTTRGRSNLGLTVVETETFAEVERETAQSTVTRAAKRSALYAQNKHLYYTVAVASVGHKKHT